MNVIPSGDWFHPTPNPKKGFPAPASCCYLLLLALLSCGPSIHSFQVDPQTMTAADSIVVNWTVTGKATLLIHENEAGANAGALVNNANVRQTGDEGNKQMGNGANGDRAAGMDGAGVNAEAMENGANGDKVASGDGAGVNAGTTGNNSSGNLRAKYMELTLVVQKDGKTIRGFRQIAVLPPVWVDTIVLRVTSLHADTLIAAGQKDTMRWGTHFGLASVASASGRPLIVTHQGKTVLLDGQHPDTVSFRGVPNSGAWEIRSLLNEAERKDPTGSPVALRLRTVLLYKKQ